MALQGPFHSCCSCIYNCEAEFPPQSMNPGNENDSDDKAWWSTMEPKIAAAVHALDQMIVLGRFSIDMTPAGLLGDGVSSTCRRGKRIATKEDVAVKIYRCGPYKDLTRITEEDAEDNFHQQVTVLRQMQNNSTVGPADGQHPDLHSDAQDFFIRLIDYSKSSSGAPARDSRELACYVVMELAECSLRSYLDSRQTQCQPFSPEEVRSLSRALLLSVAGLHARGFVHLDLKPDNIMISAGRLKLIDLDGCVPAGQALCLEDTPVSFSPCYCSPEWARSLTQCWVQSPKTGTMRTTDVEVDPSLDVWSVGMILCEFVTLSVVNQPIFDKFLKKARGKEGALLYLEWLADLEAAPIPEDVVRLDAELAEFISTWTLALHPSGRRSLADCLSHPLVESAPRKLPVLEATPEQCSKDFGDQGNHDTSKGASIRLDGGQLEAMKHRFSERAGLSL